MPRYHAHAAPAPRRAAEPAPLWDALGNRATLALHARARAGGGRDGAGGPPPLPVSHPDDAHEREASEIAAEMSAFAPAAAGRMAGAASAGVPPGRGGAPLPSADRAWFEDRLGVDLGGVRIHTDARAAAAAGALGANAFTVGGDVVFGAGRYSPGSPDGRRMLGHELVHVVQQGGGGRGISSTGGPMIQRDNGHGSQPPVP